MKKILIWLWKFLNNWLVANITISFIVLIIAWLFTSVNPIVCFGISFMIIGGLVIIFVQLRQVWWLITKTGDYEKNNKKK